VFDFGELFGEEHCGLREIKWNQRREVKSSHLFPTQRVCPQKKKYVFFKIWGFS
jgi:hypothetical protein